MPIEVRIRGAGNLERVADISDADTMVALVSGGLIVANEAKSNAPYLSGTLRRSIHIGGHTGKTPDFDGDDIGLPTEKNAILVGTNLSYARRIEYGFQDTDSLGRTYNQAAQPYLRPALDENGAAVRREFGEAIRDIIRSKVK